MYEIVEAFWADYDYGRLAADFELLRVGYGAISKIRSFLDAWQADAAQLVGDWEVAWRFRRAVRLGVDDVLNVRRRCRKTSLDSQDLWALGGVRLTDAGVRLRAAVDAALDRLLQQRHVEAGMNIIEAFWERYGHLPASDLDLGILADETDYLVSADTLKHMPAKLTFAGPFLFRGMRFVSLAQHAEHARRFEALASTPYLDVPPVLGLAAVGVLQALAREAENLARRSEGLPEIGAGWIGETELFRLVQRSFSDTAVVAHARPPWLVPQHLDVYLPEYNVGLEYQGDQHLQPLDYFGGEEAFKAQERRDKRKQLLCRRNGCTLILVYPGYDADDVQRRLAEAMRDATHTQPDRVRER